MRTDPAQMEGVQAAVSGSRHIAQSEGLDGSDSSSTVTKPWRS